MQQTRGDISIWRQVRYNMQVVRFGLAPIPREEGAEQSSRLKNPDESDILDEEEGFFKIKNSRNLLL